MRPVWHLLVARAALGNGLGRSAGPSCNGPDVHTLPARLFIAFRVAQAGPVRPGPRFGYSMPRLAPRTWIAVDPHGRCVVGLQFRDDAQGGRLDDTVPLESVRA